MENGLENPVDYNELKKNVFLGVIEVKGFEPPDTSSRTKRVTALCYISIESRILRLDGVNGNIGW